MKATGGADDCGVDGFGIQHATVVGVVAGYIICFGCRGSSFFDNITTGYNLSTVNLRDGFEMIFGDSSTSDKAKFNIPHKPSDLLSVTNILNPK
jgi:hypothetical protein